MSRGGSNGRSAITEGISPPGHLRPATGAWWVETADAFELEEHHLRLLTLAGTAWDRCEQAREALAEHGLVYVDRFDTPRCRPEVAIERDARIAFARLMRDLNLEAEETNPRFVGGGD